jgi:hypothetical protein
MVAIYSLPESKKSNFIADVRVSFPPTLPTNQSDFPLALRATVMYFPGSASRY